MDVSIEPLVRTEHDFDFVRVVMIPDNTGINIASITKESKSLNLPPFYQKIQKWDSSLLETITQYLLEQDDEYLIDLVSINVKDNDEKIDCLISIFIRGLVALVTIVDLIDNSNYLHCGYLTEIDLYSQNGLRSLRFAIIFFLKLKSSQNKLLYTCLDFINKWSEIFIEGEENDDCELLTELIINYFPASVKNSPTPDIKNVEHRLSRLEAVLGIE